MGDQTLKKVSVSFQVILGCYVKRGYMSTVGLTLVSLIQPLSVWTMRIATNVTAYPAGQVGVLILFSVLVHVDMSHDMRFPTMWYVPPAKPQISLRIRAV